MKHRINIRLPMPVYLAVVENARLTGRTVNEVIVATLATAYTKEPL